MGVLEFLSTVILITASGALAPGPLFFATLVRGMKSGAKVGLLFSIGHTAVEFPLVLLLALGLLQLVGQGQSSVTALIAAAGGAVLMVFGLLQVRDAVTAKNIQLRNQKSLRRGSLVLLGVTLTALNPFFIIWWLTVGSQLVVEAVVLASFSGVLLMYISHVWMDYVWLSFVAYLAHRGQNILSSRGYRFAVAAFGVVLLYFGFVFLVSAFR
ncbi:MAG: LysE family translocator [Aigarchaeota archaeon]|nr:LysE family translocator [Aigarchaeota archaeon]